MDNNKEDLDLLRNSLRDSKITELGDTKLIIFNDKIIISISKEIVYLDKYNFPLKPWGLEKTAIRNYGLKGTYLGELVDSLPKQFKDYFDCQYISFLDMENDYFPYRWINPKDNEELKFSTFSHKELNKYIFTGKYKKWPLDNKEVPIFKLK